MLILTVITTDTIVMIMMINSVAEWIHFTLVAIISITIKPKVYNFRGSATKLIILLIPSFLHHP